MGITIGNVIAALAFTITIQQFLKPIHRFRLRAWGVPLYWLFVGVFSGAALVFGGNVLRYAAAEWEVSAWLAPSLEVVGGFLFFVAYLATVFISLTSAKLTKWNAPRFTRSAFNLLSKASDEDYVSLFDDITKNIVPLARLAAFNEGYRWAGIDHGEPSAFYDFIHRHKLEQSSYAGTLFRLLSDPHCCKAIVRRDPTAVVAMLSDLSGKHIHCEAVAQLVQELARQSVIQDDSMLAREVGYKGFASVSLFLNAMFGDHFIIREYRPFAALTYLGKIPITSDLAERLGEAIELAWERTPELWSPQSLWDIQRVLQSALFAVRYADSRKQRHERESIRLYKTVARIVELTEQRVDTRPAQRHTLYAKDESPNLHETMPGLAAEIAVDALESVANDFGGFDEERWSDALEIVRALFPSIVQQPDGLTPTQQHAALVIKAKLVQNMEGLYPALTRVMLAIIGPYGSHHQKNRTAFRILEDVAYEQWQKFPQLHVASPDKVSDYLPPNVKYDAADFTLTHTYRFGEQSKTNLATLTIAPVNLLDRALRRADQPEADAH